MSAIGLHVVAREEIGWFGDNAETVLSLSVRNFGLGRAIQRSDIVFEGGERQRIEFNYSRNAGLAMDTRCFFGTCGGIFGGSRTGKRE